MSELLAHKLPKGWSLQLSSEFCESIADGTHDTPRPVEGNGVPLYTSKNLTKHNRLATEDVYKISISDSIEINKRSFVGQFDILYGMIGTIGNPVIVTSSDNEFSVKNVSIFRFDGNRSDSLWFYYNLCSDFVSDQVAKFLDGSTQKFVPLGVLRNLRVPVPANSETKTKIAKILTTVDNLIEKTQALIDKYTTIKQGMMADLFTRGIDLATHIEGPNGTKIKNPNYGQLRPSFEDAPELYKETELGWVPKEWEVRVLGGYLLNIEQGWSPDCETEPAKAGQWGVLKTTAVVWGGFDASANKALPYMLKPRAEYQVKVGDVLMTRAGPGNRVGVVTYVDSTQDRLMLSDKLYRIVPCQKITKGYLALLLSSADVQRQLDATKTGLAESQSNISQEIVKKLKVNLPATNEQEFIVDKIKLVTNKISSDRTYLEKLKEKKKGLMQDLLTGKVKVS